MFTIRYNRATNHLQGVAERTKSTGDDSGKSVVAYYAESACGVLTRNQNGLAKGASFESLADAVAELERTQDRKPCQRCLKAAKAQLAAEPAKKVRVTVINTANGNNRIHAADCADVAKDVRKYKDQSPWTVEVDSVEALALALWSDIAGDTTEVGSEEHRALARQFMETDDVILPCCAEELMVLDKPVKKTRKAAAKVETTVTVVEGRKTYTHGHYQAVAYGRGLYRVLVGGQPVGYIGFAGGFWTARFDDEGEGSPERRRTVLEAFDAMVG